MMNNLLKNICLIIFALVAPITLPAGGIQKNLNHNKFPKKNDAIKFTIEVFWISKPIFFLKLFCMNILSINPRVLPSNIIPIEPKSKIYIFIHPFVILLGSSKNLLDAISTLTQISLSLTFQLRKTDKVVPISSTNNSVALIPGKE